MIDLKEAIARQASGPTIMLYGPPGCAKTTLMAQAANDERCQDMLIQNVEGGLLTLSDMEFEKPPVVEPDCGPAEFEQMFWKLAGRKEEYANIKTIGCDSWTELVTKDLESTVQRNLPATSRAGKSRSSIDDAWLEDRGENSMRMARLFRWYRDLPMLKIFTAHPRFVYESEETTDGRRSGTREDKEPKAVTPALGPSLFRHVAGYCDFVWMLRLRPDLDRVHILTRPRGPYYAKTRGDKIQQALGEVIIWPRGKELFPALLDVISGKADSLPEWTKPDKPQQTKQEEVKS